MTISINILGVVLKENTLVYIGLGLAILQIGIWLFSMLKNSSLLSTVGYLKYNLETYIEILKLIESKEFESEKLIEIKNTMFSDKSSSIDAIKELDIITQIINIRSGGALNLILNALLLWDYQCIFLLEAWKKKYGEKVKDWIEGIGRLESLMSFSVLENVSEDTNFPDLVDGNPRVIAKNIGHPLINAKTRVNNDVKLDDEISLISTNGVMIRMKVRDISQMGRATRGVRVMDIDDKDGVASMARISAEILATEGETPEDEVTE